MPKNEQPNTAKTEKRDRPLRREQTERDDENTVSNWVGRFKKSEDWLKEGYFLADQRAYEYYYSYREPRPWLLANTFPPETQAAVDSVTARITKGIPRINVNPVNRNDADPARAELVEKTCVHGWHATDMDEKQPVINRRKTWFGTAFEKLWWADETETVEEQVPIELNVFGRQVKVPKLTRTVKREVVIHRGPKSEVLDHVDVFFPKGYANVEDLPWICHRIVKRRNELDPTLYPDAKLKKLDDENEQFKSVHDYKADREKVLTDPENDRDDGGTIENAWGMHEKDDDKDNPHVEILEFWVKGTKKEPKGKLISIANRKILLREDDNPTPGERKHGPAQLPFVVYKYLDDTFNLRGIGLVKQGEKAQIELADRRNMRLDNVNLIMNAHVLVQADEDVEDDELTRRPGGVTRLSNIENVAWDPPQDVTSGSYKEEEYVRSDFQKATAVSEFISGGEPTRKETATAVQELVEGSGMRFDEITRNDNKAYTRRGKLIWRMYQEHWTKKDYIRLAGTDPDFVELDPEEIQGEFDITWDVKPVLVQKEILRKQGTDLLNVVTGVAQVLPDVNVRPIVRKLAETFDELELNTDEIIPPAEDLAMKEAAKAEEDNQRLLQGEAVKPDADADPAMRLAVHRLLLHPATFQTLEPEIRANTQMLIRAYETILKERVAMEKAPPLAMPPTPPASPENPAAVPEQLEEGVPSMGATLSGINRL